MNTKFYYSVQSGLENLEQLKKVVPIEIIDSFTHLNSEEMLIQLVNQIDHDYYSRSIGTTIITMREAHELMKQSQCLVMENTHDCWKNQSVVTNDDFLARSPLINWSKYKLVAKSNQFSITWAEGGLLCHVGSGVGKFRKNLRLHLATTCGLTMGINEHAFIDHYTTYLNKRGIPNVQKT